MPQSGFSPNDTLGPSTTKYVELNVSSITSANFIGFFEILSTFQRLKRISSTPIVCLFGYNLSNSTSTTKSLSVGIFSLALIVYEEKS